MIRSDQSFMKYIFHKGINRIKWIILVTFLIGSISLAIFMCKESATGQQDQTVLKKMQQVQQNQVVMKDTDVLNQAVAVQSSLRNVATSIIPSVVNISSRKKVTAHGGFYDLDEEFLRKFFGLKEPQREQVQTMLGSGFIISDDGYILTNAHVISGADKIMINLSSSYEPYDAKVVGIDESYDLALVKITPKKDQILPYVPMGNSDDVEVGDFAVAVGNPFGFSGTFTFGVVSATGRTGIGDNLTIDGKQGAVRAYIQTDTPINRGNSGGPLVNIYGQVVGLNTAIFSETGGSIGIGFAMPINMVKEKLPYLMEGNKKTADSGFIGLAIDDISFNQAEHLGINQGAFVAEVTPGAPADSAGVKPGDVIVKVDEKIVRNKSDLIWNISNLEKGSQVILTIVRDGTELKLPITIGSKKELTGETATPAIEKSLNWMGMQFKLTQRGVVVEKVEDNSPADLGGIKPDDVIEAIQPKGEELYMIKTSDHIQEVIANFKDKESFMIQINRSKGTDIPRRLFLVIKNQK